MLIFVFLNNIAAKLAGFTQDLIIVYAVFFYRHFTLKSARYDKTRVSHTTVFIQFTTTTAIYNDIRSDDDHVIALSRDVQMSLRIHLYQALIISIQSKLHIELYNYSKTFKTKCKRNSVAKLSHRRLEKSETAISTEIIERIHGKKL